MYIGILCCLLITVVLFFNKRSPFLGSSYQTRQRLGSKSSICPHIDSSDPQKSTTPSFFWQTFAHFVVFSAFMSRNYRLFFVLKRGLSFRAQGWTSSEGLTRVSADPSNGTNLWGGPERQTRWWTHSWLLHTCSGQQEEDDRQDIKGLPAGDSHLLVLMWEGGWEQVGRMGKGGTALF